MCTNHRLIVNKYTGHELYVPCGKCEACQQEKAAHRVSRIKSNLKDGYVTLLVSLTYNRFSCPYVDKQEAYEFSKGKRMWLNVYRDCEKRKVRCVKNGNLYSIKYKTSYHRVTLTTLDFLKEVSFKGVRCVKHSDSKIGVPFYPDYQHFLARLRINLKRLYNYEKQISVYACSEFGELSLRPHFHLLIYIPTGDEEIVRSAIFESWPFSDLWRFTKRVQGSLVYKACQVAYSASSYVASYVNCGSKFPDFCKLYFKPKHSYSKGFGLARRSFSLDNILSSLDKHEMSYSRKITKQGIDKVIDVLIPAYVINRYFPRFKGYNRVAPCEILSFMRRIYDGVNPYDLGDPNFSDRNLPFSPPDGSDSEYYSTYNDTLKLVYLSDEDVHKISVRLHHAYDLFVSDLGQKLPVDEYFRLHRRVWDCYSSTALKLWYLDIDVPISEKYDNLESCFYSFSSDFVSVSFEYHVKTDLDLFRFAVRDPNKFQSVIRRTNDFKASFFRKKHDRSVRESVYFLDRDCEL